MGVELFTAILLTALTAMGVVLRATLKGATERGSERAVDRAFDRWDWPDKLRRELEKSRRVALQTKRFEAYAKLWAAMQPLALYGNPDGPDVGSLASLPGALSRWYFAEGSGLLLTREVRTFYFTLQRLLTAIDGSEVGFLSALAAQTLAAAREAWRDDGRGFAIEAPSGALAGDLELLGLAALLEPLAPAGEARS